MNQVQKIALNFSGENEFFFRSLYSDWDQYWTSKMEKATERILDKYNEPTFLIELDQLHLELGSISESDFNLKFILKYEEQFENELLKQLYGNNSFTAKKTTLKRNKAELLFYFLLHGSLPWNIDSELKNINTLFLQVAAEDGDSLRSFLRTYGHYTSLQQRLVLQFNEEILVKGIHVIAPGEGNFIISYVQFVQSKHKNLQSQKITQSPFKETVWQIIYAYLLSNRSSFFNKKSFLELTIRQLANHYLIKYDDLLQLLVLHINKETSYTVELFQLLTALQENEYKRSSTSQDWRKWMKQLTITEHNVNLRSIDEKRMTLKMLRNDQNYRFLQLQSEAKILNLVTWLVPEHAPFIKIYAKELEQQKSQGMLQGKAGSEFRILKWRILFPILLENNSTGFNRHHFVERVLQKIGAHYNLKLIEILNYLYFEKSSFKIDQQLIGIIQELYQKHQPVDEPTLKRRVLTVRSIIQKIQNHAELTFEEVEEWVIFLEKEENRNSLLNKLSEKEHKLLIINTYKYQSQFIITYSEFIENHQDKANLQGKITGNLRKLKWRFIHEILLEPKSRGFNKRHFVEGIIQKIASHFNLKKEELITFFYLEAKTKNVCIPYEIFQIMELIHKDYTQKQIKKENKINDSKSKNLEKTNQERTEILLFTYFGKDAIVISFIRELAKNVEFVNFIEPILKIESELGKFLLKEWKITISRKQLLLLLLRISNESKSFSKADILHKMIVLFISELKNEEQQLKFINQLSELSKKDKLLKKSLEIHEELSDELNLLPDTQDEMPQELEQNDVSFIENAGLIIIAPFLPRLFTMLKLTENGKFTKREAQIKAIFLMQYAVFKSTDFPEFELGLNKLLVGFKTGIPLPKSIELSSEEKKTVEGMLQGAVQHWTKVKTIDGLREAFLQRAGKLDEKGDEIELLVESKAFDMLLDNIPWNFRTTKFSWMEKAIQVKWR